MILRSLMKHVSDQNWVAVFLDFLIVVVGVFIGIQVSNWNEVRVQHRQEADLLERMQAEAEDARSEMANYYAVHAQILEGSLALAVRLNEPESCLAMGDDIKQLIVSVGDFPPPRFSLATASEALDTGRLSLISSVAVRDGVRDMVDEMSFLDRQWQRYVRVKQETELMVYSAAGLSLASAEALKVRPGQRWDGIDQYVMQSPDEICGNAQVISSVANVALTQHIFTVYIEQVSSKLDLYTGMLSDDGRIVKNRE